MISYGLPIDGNRNDSFLIIVRLEFVLTEQFPLENPKQVAMLLGAEGVNESLLAVMKFLPGQFPQAVVFERRRGDFLCTLGSTGLIIGTAGQKVKKGGFLPEI